MSEITIREATMADKELMFDLGMHFSEYSAHKSQNHKEFMPDNIVDILNADVEDTIDAEDAATFLAFDGAECAGYVYVYFCKTCWFTCISDLFIKENFRRKGVGEVLLKKAESWASQYSKEFDCPLRIEVYGWNDEAISFYKKHGYDVDCFVFQKKK